MWQQRADETDEQYWAFHDWLDRGTARGAPAADVLAIAARFEWAERALAFERANDLQRKLNDPTKTPEQQVVDNLTAMVQIEAQKILERSAKDPSAVVSLKDLLSTINLMAELQKKALTAASAAKYDYSKLTTDELRAFMQLVKKMTTT